MDRNETEISRIVGADDELVVEEEEGGRREGGGTGRRITSPTIEGLIAKIRENDRKKVLDENALQSRDRERVLELLRRVQAIRESMLPSDKTLYENSIARVEGELNATASRIIDDEL
jgi:hypothetical protein